MKNLKHIMMISLILVLLISLFGCKRISEEEYGEALQYKEMYDLLFISYREIKNSNEELKEEKKELEDKLKGLAEDNATSQMLIKTLTERYLSAMNYINLAEHILEENNIPFYYSYEEE